VREVVLALSLGELDHRHLMVTAEQVQAADEVLADRIEQRRRGVGRAAVAPQELHHAPDMLQPRLIDVQEHPIQTLHLECHVIIKDIADAAGYRHLKLRSRVTRRTGLRH
jgi:hypothetical protein